MPCNNCPLCDDYSFKTKCRVTSCKFYTEQTKRRCMALDSVFASTSDLTEKKAETNCGLTDVELRLLKFPTKTKREVAAERKRSCEKVRAILTLNQILEDRAYEPDTFVAENPLTQRILEHPLFQDADLGLEPWMTSMIFDEEFLARFGNPKLHLLFGITDREFEQHKTKGTGE